MRKCPTHGCDTFLCRDQHEPQSDTPRTDAASRLLNEVQIFGSNDPEFQDQFAADIKLVAESVRVYQKRVDELGRELAEAKEKLRSDHCKDCCCAKSWAALGDVTGAGSIPEHIEALRAERDKLKSELAEANRLRAEHTKAAEVLCKKNKGGTYTCLDCGHRGWRPRINSPCPMCGKKATAANTV